MAVSGDYKLQLNPEKRNVFVTQLHDREDEDDVVVFPIVKESGDKLIDTGINTLQRTLLLKKEVEVAKVDAELEAKRNEFNQRMEACAQKQIEVQKKQQRMKDRVGKFEKFISENESKRRRAIQKYQQEVKIKEQKTNEYDLLVEQLEELKARQEHLANKLVKYKKFEDYLLRVIDVMPEDYLPSSEDKIKGLMMRHKTLNESNKDLIINVEVMQDELEQMKQTLETMRQDHNKEKASDSSTLAILQDIQENLAESNQQSESKFSSNKGNMRNRRTEIGVIFMAINNIYEKCTGTIDVPSEKDTWIQKLLKIRDYLNDRRDVAQMAMMTQNNSVSNSSSSKGQRQPQQPVKVEATK